VHGFAKNEIWEHTFENSFLNAVSFFRE